MAILDMYKSIILAIDQKQHSIGVFIDLSKAFNTLNHHTLLHKLQYYGIHGLPLKWFESYLHNRQQCVNINRVSSSFSCITCGVSQGSILGQLLFLLYDIVSCSAILQFILFADNTSLFPSNSILSNLFKTVNGQLAELSDWFIDNKLSLNVKKNNYILFTIIILVQILI